MVQVLQLNRAGLPVKWLNLEHAAYAYTRGKVEWALGDPCATLRGGTNAISGLQSRLEIQPIICVVGDKEEMATYRAPAPTSQLVFRRDRCLCAYCGQVFREDQLTLEHIYPQSRGGKNTWMNLVAACKSCNNRKDCRTPEEAKMPLLYVPYEPNLHEAFILRNRVIRGDQQEFLLQSVPKHSRLWQ